MEQWLLLRKGADYLKIGEKFHISPRCACLIRNKDIIGDEAIEKYLHGSLADLYDGMLMKDMDLALDIIREKINSHEKIRIIGDYDIDGVNATYILMEGFGRLGATVDSDIPDRIKDGYGLNIDLIERAYQDHVDTIITCDNGIAAKDAIRYGKSLGMTIIVTDHHEIPYETDEETQEKKMLLPPADAVIDPKRMDCQYPFSGLCGAAVAYKLVEALFEVMGRDADELDDLLENVAIATVGDVMDLVDENRILVKEGLARIRKSSNIGLRSLIECNQLEPSAIDTYHIGFVLGPCLNASGRLDTAKRALALFNAKTKKDADIIAGDLKALNDSRKDMTQKAVDRAVELIEYSELKEDKILVVYLPDCHESLAGIVAGRIRERYQKPAIVLTDGLDDVKGSGRSIDAYHMFEGLHECEDLLLKYGGHKLAAGLSLESGKVDALRRALNDNCTLTEQDMAEKVLIDMEMGFLSVTEEFVNELSVLEPFGKGNTKPVFVAQNVMFHHMRLLGKDKKVLKCMATDQKGNQIEALMFTGIENFEKSVDERYGTGTFAKALQRENDGIRLSVTYYPSINEFRGKKTPQIVITHYMV